jgi:magnesium transporter
MDQPKKLLKKILDHTPSVADQNDILQKSLWQALVDMHPVDIADFLAETDKLTARKLFDLLPHELQLEVFKDLSNSMKAFIVGGLSEKDQVNAFRTLSPDELTDLFDHFSDEELKRYMGLLQRHVRERVMSLMKFDPQSAGGVMQTDVISLIEDFTVEKSIQLLQRLKPSKDIHTKIFVVTRSHRLVGSINLEDLVLHKSSAYINSFMQKNEFVALANQDQEEVAKKMIHYNLTIAPVVDNVEAQLFLGVIPADTLVDVVMEEAGEDIQKIGAVIPLKYPYFETHFLRLLWARAYILIILLLTGSFSTSILHSFESSLNAFLLSFIPMLISVGGNTSSQTSAVLIQGMAVGDITFDNMFRFLRREMRMAFVLSIILGFAAFLRVYLTGGAITESLVISLVLACIVMIAALLGSCTPLILKKINIDPAFSAGPFLATVMDILGTSIFCFLIFYLIR